MLVIKRKNISPFETKYKEIEMVFSVYIFIYICGNKIGL